MPVKTQVIDRAEQIMSLMYALKKTINQKMKSPSHHLKDDLTIAQMTVMHIIAEHENISLRKLAQINVVAVSTMSEMINRLVKLDLIKRCPDQHDRRMVNICMTGKGKKIHADRFKRMQQVFLNLLSDVEEKDQIKLINAFKTINRIVHHTVNQG